MAAEKKKADKKNVKGDVKGKVNENLKPSTKNSGNKAEKKETKKVALINKKSVKKAVKGDVSERSVEINVPRGGQVIEYFTLTPALPTASAPGDWIFSTPDSAVDISNLIVRFPLNPSALERQFERAILVVQIQQNPATNGIWRFALGGVATFQPDADPDNDIVVEIIDNGFTMLAYVQVLENSEEYIPFQFVASFTDQATGVVSIYQSDDPGVLPKRP
jgi:hypothetical protein